MGCFYKGLKYKFRVKEAQAIPETIMETLMLAAKPFADSWAPERKGQAALTLSACGVC